MDGLEASKDVRNYIKPVTITPVSVCDKRKA